MRRAFFAPEVLQISAMDCGVASLVAFLSGYGIYAHYERLREACQTSVDGTSIDALEDIAVELGLDVCQHIVPVDLFTTALEPRLPAIVVTRIVGLPMHFLVVWRRVGRAFQVMDPASGRRWVTAAELERMLHVTDVTLPVNEFRAWFGESSYAESLAILAGELLTAAAAGEVRAVLAAGAVPIADLAALDDALRLTAHLDPARRRTRMWRTEAFARVRAAALASPAAVPDGARGITVTDEGVTIRAAVALAPVVRDLRVAMDGPPAPRGAPHPARRGLLASKRQWKAPVFGKLVAMLDVDARALASSMALGLVAAGVFAGVEILVFRAVWDAPRTLATFGQRLSAAAVVAALLLLLVLLDASLSWGARALGRYLEIRLRVMTCELLPRASDEFVRSRPTSDLAYRAHGLTLGHEFPTSLFRMARTGLDALVSVVALAVVDPTNVAVLGGWILALALVVTWSLGRLRRVDGQFQAHGMRLLLLFLDALRGFRPLRLHGYQDAFRGEQDDELVRLKETGQLQTESRALLASASEGLGVVVVLVLLLVHLRHSGDPRHFIVVAFWAFRLPGLAKTLMTYVQEYPAQRSAFARLLELGSYAEPEPTATAEPHVAGPDGIAISLRDVSVVANGHTLLSGVTLDVPSSQHVAIVGPSGAGKSSLVSLLLGIGVTSRGKVTIDGEPLDEVRLQRLRDRTAWVDPAATLWNDSLVANLEYAARGVRRRDLLETLETSDLLSVLEGMDQGLSTSVGSEGRLVSGGEGQRVRLGRALLRAAPRLVVLDEPFRGLDRKTRRRLAFRARLAWRRATMFFISHDIEHALDFDRVLVIEEGRIVEDGHPLELASAAASRFAQMLTAERRVLDETWSPRRWRRLRVENRAVREVP